MPRPVMGESWVDAPMVFRLDDGTAVTPNWDAFVEWILSPHRPKVSPVSTPP